MKRLKRQISMLTLLFFMCCFVLPIIPPTPAEAAEGTSLTDAQINAVIDWAYANAYGSAYSNYQCLAYVYQAYHNAIGVNIGPGGSYSSAIEASRNLELHSGEAPRGAIVFWEAAPSNSYYGHAGISVGGGRAISANVTWSKYPDQRVFDHSIEGFLLYDNSGRKLNYIGWAWPYGMGGTDGITPSSIQNNAASNITETNVYLSAKVLNNYQRVTEVGCYLSTDGVNWPYKASDAVNITDAYTNVWYDNTARDFGIALQPGTTYYYKFYAVVNGNYNEGQVGSFVTKGGSAPANVVLNVNKRNCTVGDTIIFTPSGDNVVKYMISVLDCKTKENVFYQHSGFVGPLQWKPTKKGTYQAWITALNEYGHKDSELVYIEVSEGKGIEIQNNNVANITENNAKLSARVLNNYQKVTEVGCYLGKSQNNLNYKASDKVNIADVYTNVWYENIPSEFGMTLEPGMTYYYQFYAVVNGQTYTGSIGQFTTKKAEEKKAEVTFSNLIASNITQTDATLTAKVDNKSNSQITEIGCSLGVDEKANQWRTSSSQVGKGTNTIEFNLLQNFTKASILPGQTYYYRFYAVVNGKTVESNTKSFQLLSPEEALDKYFKALAKAVVEDKVGDLQNLLIFKGATGLGVSDADVKAAKNILGNIGDVQTVFETMRISSEHFITLGDSIGKLWVIRMESVENFMYRAKSIQDSSVNRMVKAYDLGKQDRESQTTANKTKVEESEKQIKKHCDELMADIERKKSEFYMNFHPNLKKELNVYKKELKDLKENYDLMAFYNLGRYGTEG